MKTKMYKKGAIEQLNAMVVPLLVIGIVLVIGFLVMAEAKDQALSIAGKTSGQMNEANGSGAYNATSDVQNAMADIPGWLPIIVITVIGAALIGLVSMFRA